MFWKTVNGAWVIMLPFNVGLSSRAASPLRDPDSVRRALVFMPISNVPVRPFHIKASFHPPPPAAPAKRSSADPLLVASATIEPTVAENEMLLLKGVVTGPLGIPMPELEFEALAVPPTPEVIEEQKLKDCSTCAMVAGMDQPGFCKPP